MCNIFQYEPSFIQTCYDKSGTYIWSSLVLRHVSHTMNYNRPPDDTFRRSVSFIEKAVYEKTLSSYANTHTSTCITAQQTAQYRTSAR